MNNDYSTESGVEGADMPDLSNKSAKSFADELTKIAVQQLYVSSKFKEPLMTKWKEYENLKAGKVKKKLRIPFQVALPVFSGMIDTLAASFNEPIELEFYPTKPADYFKAQKVQGAWNTEKSDSRKDARWDLKSRFDKQLAIMHGRGILKYYAESDPKYKSVLDNADPLYFHCQPLGGGILENHLFAGQEDIFRSEAQLEKGAELGFYDKEQVKKLKTRSADPNYVQEVGEQIQLKMQRFNALGLNPEQNNYVGEKMYQLVEWVMTYKGKRYYLLFDPGTTTWIRCEELKDIFSLDTLPWKSWATHEDSKVFWTQSYTDIFYPVADSVVTLFNQELTNREKKNLGARAYDKDMFFDLAKLDSAQYRADALVPVDTKGGTRKISEGLYRFDTPELQGTINLLDWIQKSTSRDMGVSDIAQGSAMDATKKVNVAYMEQAAIAKRIGYKSESYSECWGEIGRLYFQGLKDHMKESMSIQLLGDSGFEWEEVTREDLDLEGDMGIRVISSTARKEESQKKKQGRIEAVKLLIEKKSQNVNSAMMDEVILRDIGEYDEDEIKLWMDTQNMASKESVAKAHIAIQLIISNKKPEINYNADKTFLKIIRDYAMDHRAKLGMKKFHNLMVYFTDHAKIAQKNTVDAANERAQQVARAQQGQEKPGQSTAPAPQPQPVQQPVVNMPEQQPTPVQ